jgi:hypothetical protein
MKPKPHPVQDAYWEKDSTSQQKAPHTLTKAGKDMVCPCCHTDQSKDPSHVYSFVMI